MRTIPLNFRLGDVALFSLPLRLSVRLYSLSELISNSDPTEVVGVRGDLALLSCAAGANLPGVMRRDRVIRYIPHTYERFYVDVRGSFEQYLEKFSAKTRNTSKRKVRKFAEISGGQIDFREYTTPDAASEFHTIAKELSTRTYQERLLKAGLPTDAAFIARLRQQAESGALRAYLLFHEGRPVSYLYCPVEAGTAVYEHLGFDPEYAKWSPGFVLQWLVLERLFADSAVEFFDFTQGEGEQKRFFATGSIRCADVYVLQDRFKIRLMIYGHAWLASLSSGLGTALDAIGLKSRIKRILRRT